MASSLLLLAALALASKGYSIFPCKPGEKIPLTIHGFHDATKDESRITAWWQKAPSANIGLPTGKINGISVVDADGEEGIATFEKLGLPESLTIQTPRGGKHIYYKYNPGLQTTTNVMPGIDIRNDGAYVVAPPSQVNGISYNVICPAPIRDITFNPFLKISIAEGRIAEGRIDDNRQESNWIVTSLKGVPEKMRNDTATMLAGYLHKKGIPGDVIYQLLVPFALKCSPPMDLPELRQTVDSVHRYARLKGVDL